MAEFDPYEPAENESKEQAREQDTSGHGQSRPSDYDQCGCDSTRTGPGQFDFERRQACETDAPRSDSFVADWSGAEKSLAEQAASFEAREIELSQPEPQTFWNGLVQSQDPMSPIESSELSRPQQSEQFWGDLVRSQASPATSESAESFSGFVSSKPTGMGWAEDEASEWAPPQREHEPVEAAAEAVESENTAPTRRDDVAWGLPASAQDAWESVRSEALDADSKPQSLMDAAVKVAEAKEKKARAKKPAAKKKAKAKKPAARKTVKKAAAKKKAVKKVVKKAPTVKNPPMPIENDPTRRAA